ncbi:MAG TPA: FtsX-like permease family protein [Stenotrophobium sp.]|nr:FtsX-like permease family protein [Stenotrophobium sp.]
MRHSLRYALHRLRRGWRSGDLLVLALALAVAVAAASAVNLFTERVRAALDHQSGDAIGADLIYSAHDPLPASLAQAVNASGAHGVGVVQFASVVTRGAAMSLASIKAVSDGYPARGSVTLSSEPFGPTRSASGIPARGEAWVDLKLWTALNLKPGAEVQAGNAQFRVSAIIVRAPDSGGYMDLAPGFMINADDLPASKLLTPGARAQYSLMVAATAAQLHTLGALPVPAGVRRTTPQDARPEIRAALQRAGQFIDIAVLAATLLAAVAIALSAHQYGLRMRDEVALLKCLGARERFIGQALLLTLLLLGALAGAAGAALGWLAQEAIARLLAGLMQIALPPASLLPLAQAWGLGLLMLLGFAVPPVLAARRDAPIRVFQRDAGGSGFGRGIGLAAALAAAALLWLQTGEPRLAAEVFAGAMATLATLALLSWLLVLALAPLRKRVGASWRFGLGNLSRRRGATVAQAVALGLALHALLMITVVRQDLLSSWQKHLPADTPNQFLVNIQGDQRDRLEKFFGAHGYPPLELVPMARGRLVALNGKPVSGDSFDDPETQRWINRGFNLSSADTLRDDNTLTGGSWWGNSGDGKPWLSADTYAVEHLHLKLGDRVTIDFAGQPIELTLRSIRKIRWDSFRPNFFLLTPPGTLDAVPRQWIASFYLPPANRTLLRELIAAFPNVTPLDIGAAMAQVRGIIDRIVRAIECVFLFALAAGLTVLLATIQGTRRDRVRETALLRALGASSSMIVRGLLAEYAVLGLLSGTVAALTAQVVTWVLADTVFHIPYGPRPLIWLTGALTGCAIVTLLGWLSLRPVLKTPPTVALQTG